MNIPTGFVMFSFSSLLLTVPNIFAQMGGETPLKSFLDFNDEETYLCFQIEELGGLAEDPCNILIDNLNSEKIRELENYLYIN